MFIFYGQNLHIATTSYILHILFLYKKLNIICFFLYANILQHFSGGVSCERTRTSPVLVDIALEQPLFIAGGSRRGGGVGVGGFWVYHMIFRRNGGGINRR